MLLQEKVTKATINVLIGVGNLYSVDPIEFIQIHFPCENFHEDMIQTQLTEGVISGGGQEHLFIFVFFLWWGSGGTYRAKRRFR